MPMHASKLWEVMGRIAPTNIENTERENNKNQEIFFTIDNPSSFLILFISSNIPPLVFFSHPCNQIFAMIIIYSTFDKMAD